jgi:UDP-GlcNAc:undecaprenyl-phosphate/decaprenyl-phosphate GlcNAc-1-phosphate transferase
VFDLPNERSSHTDATPRGGGIAAATAIVAGLALSYSEYEEVSALMLTVALFCMVGAGEDIWGVDLRLRFVALLACGLFVGVALIEYMSIPVWLGIGGVSLWLLGYANSFNFMDGVNGISGFNAAVGGIVYAVMGTLVDEGALAMGGAVIAASALGFLPWNAVRARVFLGDSGSYALGAGIATLSVVAVFAGVPPTAAVAPMLVYMADTLWTLQRRIRSGDRWYEAHRSHIYQRLGDFGWSHLRVASTVGLWSLLVGLAGLGSLAEMWVTRVAATVTIAILLVAYISLPFLVARVYQDDVEPA